METKKALHKAFKMKDLGELKYFLSIKFVRYKQGIVMHQRKYARELVSETSLSAAKPTPTPCDTTEKLTTSEYDQHVPSAVRHNDENSS